MNGALRCTLSDKILSFVLPTYNEAGNIERLISEIDRYVEDFEKEYIVVDDNSGDGTWQLVEKMAAKDPRVRLILRMEDPGLTPSLQEGINASRGDLVSWMDCDLSMPPSEIPRMISKIENGYDCVIGSRYVAGGGVVFMTGGPDSLSGILLSMLLNHFAIWVLGDCVRDYTSGFIIVNKGVLDKYPLKGNYGEYFIELMVQLCHDGVKVAEIPYLCQPREAGQSKSGPDLWTYFKRGWRYVITIVTLRLRYGCSSDKSAPGFTE